MTLHKDLVGANLHTLYYATYADETARLATGALPATAVGQPVLVQDSGDGTAKVYIVASTTPTWTQFYSDAAAVVNAAEASKAQEFALLNNTPLDLLLGQSQFWILEPADDATYPSTWRVTLTIRSVFFELSVPKRPVDFRYRVLDVAGAGMTFRATRRLAGENAFGAFNLTGGGASDLQTTSAGTAIEQTIVQSFNTVSDGNFPSLVRFEAVSGSSPGTYRFLELRGSF